MMERLVEQPVQVDFHTADQVFVKQMVVKRAGTFIPQHSHCYDHTTMVATGRVAVWVDGEPLGNFTAPAALLMRSGTKHLFETLEDNTTLYCIHNLSHGGAVQVLEEHELTGDL
jgi:quercetin dioxygenase-like cupin family protein